MLTDKPGHSPKTTVSYQRLVSGVVPLCLLCACVTTPPAHPGPPPVKAAEKPQILTRLGDDVRKSGDSSGAVALYQSASAAAPRDPVPLTHLGEALNDTGDPIRAEQAFRTALTLQPQNQAAQHGLAVSLLAQGRPAEALPLLQALDKPGASARLLGAEGTALDMLGRRQDAQAVYRRGLLADPTDAALHGNLALSLALQGQQDAALAELRAAIGAPQPDARQEANAVLVLALLNRIDEARGRGRQTVGDTATETLIDHAGLARQTNDPLQQAQALGVLTSASPVAPPAPRTLLPPPVQNASQAAPPVAASMPATVPAQAPAAEHSPATDFPPVQTPPPRPAQPQPTPPG